MGQKSRRTPKNARHERPPRPRVPPTSGRPVRVTVTARAADKYGASEMQLHYWAGSGEGSGWQTFNLTRTFQDYSFIYEPPARNPGTEPAYDYLAIRPVVPEKERAVFVSSITLQRMEPGSNPDS